MAVRNESTSARKAWLMALALVVLFAVALFLRAYWNLDAAQQNGQFVLSGGSDPYYHKRAVDAIQARGFHTLVDDPLLNYPFGSINPNPPLHEWTIAVAGHFMAPMFGGDEAVSTWWATEWSPAVWGALTVFPIYFIAKAIFDDRRVGLVAATFWTLSTSAIDATGLGDADHDAALMFFACLAFLFYILAIRQFRGDGNWVTSWKDGGAIGRGLSTIFRERAQGFGYAALSGLGIAAVALMWKGFPYVIGILFAYAGLQMVLDHWKNRDSTGLFLATLIALVVGTLVAYPYYSITNTTNFVRPVWFIIGGFVIGGLVLVPTRDLPTILVMPAALVVALLGIAAAFFVLPDIANSLLYATVYFKRTALYETIAEAHPASFSDIAFGIGPLLWGAAVVTWVVMLFRLRKYSTRPYLFAIVWAAIAFYMANNAIRFLFNAIPVFVALAAAGTVWVVDWLDFGAIRKSFQANRGWQGFRKGVRPMHIVGVILIALLLVVPNVMLAADAAIPRTTELKLRENSTSDFVKGFFEKRFGAYGQGFIEDYWVNGLDWLDQYDAATPDPAQRPAFLSWWDYGHWAIAVGKHPAVADNFQNGYEFAANFILSQNETSAIQLMSARLVPLMSDAKAEALLSAQGVTDAAAAYNKLVKWQYVDTLDMEHSAAFLDAVEKETGKKIRYFAVDVRMMPLDDPSTQNLDYGSSIFYAPVKLKGDDPDDYVATTISTGGTSYITQKQFEQTIREAPTKRVGATAERLEFKPQFFNSMYYRSYVGTPPQVTQAGPILGDKVIQALNTQEPALGLTHFHLIYATSALKIIEYSPGAKVSGTLTEEGAPVQGATITVYDDAGSIMLNNLFPQAIGRANASDFNIPHNQTLTDASGKFTAIAPSNLPGGNITIVASKQGIELARGSTTLSRADAEAQKTFTVDLVAKRGGVKGLVFEDKNGDGIYNASVDQALSNMTVTVAGKTATTDGEGNYEIQGISAGSQIVNVTSDKYDVAPTSAAVTVRPGETATHNVALDLKPATVSGVVYADLNDNAAYDAGEEVAFRAVDFKPDANVTANPAREARPTTDSSGNYTTTLAAGTYTVVVDFTAPDGSKYSVNETYVAESGVTARHDVRLTKS